MTIGHNSKARDIEELPLSLFDIADEFGYDMAAALVKHFPGLELRIPHKLKGDHQLLALGREQAEALCAYCPADTILVPKSLDYQGDRTRCRRQVRTLQEKGLTMQQIAQVLNITQRHARRLLNKKVIVDDRQLGLFDDTTDD